MTDKEKVDQQRWLAVSERDKHSIGKFFYAVRTTRVVCRPACPSRLPKKENVIFYDRIDDALHAGYRPCKRCQPDQLVSVSPVKEKIVQACRIIDSSETPPDLATLASNVGLSKAYFHRLFKAETGITVKAYVEEKRTQRLHDALNSDQTITEAIYAAGYESTGRFYEASQEKIGMTPSEYRKGGEKQRIYFAIGECSLGSILVATTEKGICFISLADDAEILLNSLQAQFTQAQLIGADTDYETYIADVIGLIKEPDKSIDLPLDIQGTIFQRKVWEALRAIPFGTTISYSELAKRVDKPKAVRAVASACAANKLAIVIPCHRVVRSDGSLSGYRWGLDRKRRLITHEKKLVSK